MIQRLNGLCLNLAKSSWETFSRRHFWLAVSKCGMYYTESFFICKCSSNMLWILPIAMPKNYAISHINHLNGITNLFNIFVCCICFWATWTFIDNNGWMTIQQLISSLLRTIRRVPWSGRQPHWDSVLYNKIYYNSRTNKYSLKTLRYAIWWTELVNNHTHLIQLVLAFCQADTILNYPCNVLYNFTLYLEINQNICKFFVDFQW